MREQRWSLRLYFKKLVDKGLISLFIYLRKVDAASGFINKINQNKESHHKKKYLTTAPDETYSPSDVPNLLNLA